MNIHDLKGVVSMTTKGIRELSNGFFSVEMKEHDFLAFSKERDIGETQ